MSLFLFSEGMVYYKLIYNRLPTYSVTQDRNTILKEYYEIVDEARPLSGFFPTHADFLTEMHF